MMKTAEAKCEDLDMRSLVELHKIYSSLNEMGHTDDEISDMLGEYHASQNHMPVVIVDAAQYNDAKTILDWLGSPVDEGKLNSVYMGEVVK